MNFFRGAIDAIAGSRVIQKVREVFTREKSTPVKNPTPPSTPKPVGPITLRVETTGLNEARQFGNALFRIMVTNALSDAAVEYAADVTVGLLEEAVAPISRTGELASSFRYRRESPGEFVVYSTLDRAIDLLDEERMNEPPSISGLMEWMENKPEFADYTRKEKERAAWAIRRSVVTGAGRNSTGASDIINLGPGGERAFDYRQQVMDELNVLLNNNTSLLIAEVLR